MIELLVVISIIALLIAILLPALSKARDSARDSVCLSNQRQHAIGLFTYAAERKGQFPVSNAQINPGPGVYAVWFSGFYMGHGLSIADGILDDPRTFYCPRSEDPKIQYPGPSSIGWYRAWPSNGKMPHEPGALGPGQGIVQTHYHYRSFLEERTDTWRSVDINRDPNPSDLAMMADNFSEPERGVDIHHGDGYNVAYADGHARFVTDRGFLIRDYNGGAPYHASEANYRRQHEVWRDLLSESAN